MSSNKDKYFRKLYLQNRIVKYIITFAGFSSIVSIAAILLFLLLESSPLIKGAKIEEIFSFSLPDPDKKPLLTGTDPYMRVYYIMSKDGVIKFYYASDQSLMRSDTLSNFSEEKILCVSRGSLMKDVFAAGTDRGRLITFRIRFKNDFIGQEPVVNINLKVLDIYQVDPGQQQQVNHIEELIFRENDDLYRFYAWKNHHGGFNLRIYDPDEEENYLHDIKKILPADFNVSAFTLDFEGSKLIAGAKDGRLTWYDISGLKNIELIQHWEAYRTEISALGFLIGGQGLITGSAEGSVNLWIPVRIKGQEFEFQKINSFESHSKAIKLIIPSPRDRNFLSIGSDGEIHLNYSTTGRTQLKFSPTEEIVSMAAFSPKSNAIIAADSKNRFGFYNLDNPHPEITTKTLFGKTWYEGYDQPEFVWQSTGGSSEFEPKLSMIPLIFGTLKGTLYAMFFSVPIALLGAIFLSQFGTMKMKQIIKPTIEIMAAIPSVIIGFLAGLYFSPLFEKFLMEIMLFMILIPVFFYITIVLWRFIPAGHKTGLKTGFELLLALVPVILSLAAAFSFADLAERVFFAGNFQQWLFSVIGVTYETRNSLVVGFALGFAVIPIIFTVAEDALSNVPESLVSASLALGASKWQTVRRIVVPAAAGGIFAAIMLGLGRAIGETMIVLMATGNTPILDINPFNGFRAMSACIAVEIPEAPVGGTLYRVLFLTALLLFAFTFVLNTISSIIGDKLRKKYARF
ncbi:MAG: ABC transporter permease subunit [Calditrichaceae bacterium]|nr:ABC transporter permease subunit [Calditrichaceae bacterium]MBN2710040.1 ABC transporter permease subunit [Calditrichaceae bacterium]RQV92140.1 MAG: ABC transporter permease subunit [Calditrichota bacterium]